MAFKDQTGAVALPTLTPDGAVPVDLESDASVPVLLARLVWETTELRRAYCEATGQFFNEYPGG